MYLFLQPESSLPDISGLYPFRCVIIIEEEVPFDWQSLVSKWLVKAGCLYMMAWGKDSSAWHDAVDLAMIEEFNYGNIPEERFMMTTWHENEQLEDVFWFAKNNAFHPNVALRNTLILHISRMNKEKELLAAYAAA